LILTKLLILKKQLDDKQPFFADEFNRLVTSLKKYQNIGFKKHECSFFKSTDKTIIGAYNNLKEINNILEKVGSSIVIEEKYCASKQATNILSDPMIYLPQLAVGAYCVSLVMGRNSASNTYVFGSPTVVVPNTNYLDYSRALLLGTALGFVYPPHCLIANGFSALIAYIRHK
jgi:hypothetical protein